MTYRELFYKATRLINHNQITLGEYEEMTKPLDREVEQEPTIKALGEELRKARKGIADEKVLIGYNLAVAICNKHLGESEDT